MFTKLSVLAIGTGGTDFGGAALSAAKNTAKSFDSLWAANFSSGGPMWVPLVALGISLAVFSVAFLVYSFLVNSTKGNDIEAWKQLVWPFIVGILLFNNGALAADGIVGIRNFINNTSTDLLEATNNNISLQQAFKSAKDYAITQQQIGALMRQCQSRIGKDQIDCIASASKTAKELLDKQTGGAWATWLKAQVDQAQERVAAIGQTTAEGCQTGGATGCVGGAVVGAFDAVNALASDQFTQYVMPWLLSAGSAWQAGFELALLLTGLLGALAIGLSTLPVEDNGKPIVIWLGSFFGLFVVKISYNILVGLAATALVTNTGSDPSWFSVFVAFIAPVMSIVAGSFSGVLVFQGLVQLGGAAANSALSLGLRLAK